MCKTAMYVLMNCSDAYVTKFNFIENLMFILNYSSVYLDSDYTCSFIPML